MRINYRLDQPTDWKYGSLKRIFFKFVIKATYNRNSMTTWVDLFLFIVIQPFLRSPRKLERIIENEKVRNPYLQILI